MEYLKFYFFWEESLFGSTEISEDKLTVTKIKDVEQLDMITINQPLGDYFNEFTGN